MFNPKIDDKIVLREEGDEAFLFNPDTGSIKVLNNTGIFIWKLCNGGFSKEDILKKILDAYNIKSKESAEKDLDDFLDQAQKLGYIS